MSVSVINNCTLTRVAGLIRVFISPVSLFSIDMKVSSTSSKVAIGASGSFFAEFLVDGCAEPAESTAYPITAHRIIEKNRIINHIQRGCGWLDDRSNSMLVYLSCIQKEASSSLASHFVRLPVSCRRRARSMAPRLRVRRLLSLSGNEITIHQMMISVV